MKLTDEQRQQAKPIIEALHEIVNEATHSISHEIFNTEEYRLFIFYYTFFKDAYDRNEFRVR